MKLLLITSLLIFPYLVYPAKGLVIGHEVPLFSEDSYNSPIVQYNREGTILFIHDQHLTSNPNEEVFLTDIETLSNNEITVSRDFFETLDKNGRRAFVPKQFIKLITHDSREESNPGFLTYDPTDYRLPEPLPPQYPLPNPYKFRAGALILTGPSEKTNYPYPESIIKEDYRSRMGLNLFYLKNISNDLSSRIFLGLDIKLEHTRTMFQLEGEAHTSGEYSNTISFGPRISYDAFRNENRMLSLYTSALINFYFVKINQEDVYPFSTNEEILDNADYRSQGFTGCIGSIYQQKISTDFFIVGGSDLFFSTPHTMRSGDNHQFSNLWNSNQDIYYRPAHIGFNLFFGIQTLF